MGIADFDTLDAAAARNEDDYQEWIESLAEEFDSDTGIAQCVLADSEVPFVESGLGDGTYSTHTLVADGNTVGLRVRFSEAAEG